MEQFRNLWASGPIFIGERDSKIEKSRRADITKSYPDLWVVIKSFQAMRQQPQHKLYKVFVIGIMYVEVFRCDWTRRDLFRSEFAA